MGFDKTKVIRAAEKFLSQGKIPAAIKEYEKVVDEDPDDFTTLNMLGDLYARIGNKQEAAKCFAMIAEHYREQGFNTKAIAMFKKIDRIQPGSPEMAAKLAPLYEAQGQIVEARASYQILVESYRRAGQSQKEMELLRKIADLDPNNVEIRLKLAEGFLREGFKTDAAEAFKQAGAQLLARGKTERALEACSKALEIIPEDREALSGVVAAHRALGSADEGAEVLERALKSQPDDVELHSMLASTYIEAEDPRAAERATFELVRRETTSFARFLDVAQLYLKKNEVDEAVRILTSISEQMLTAHEEVPLMELLNEALAQNPEQMDALRLLFRLYTWQQDEEGTRLILERLVEAARNAGLEDEERRALSHLLRIEPDNGPYARRLEELGGSMEERADEYVYATEAPPQEVPTFESFMLMNETAEASQPPAQAAEAPAMEFEWNSVSQPEAAPAADPSSSFADLNDWTDATSGATTEQPASTGFQEFDFSAPVQQASASATEDASGASSATDRASILRQELESVDFYITQGYTDIARDTLNMIERQFGPSPEIDARRQQLEPESSTDFSFGDAAASSGQPPVETSDGVTFTGFARYDVAKEAPEASPESMDDVDAAFAGLAGESDQTVTSAPAPPAPSPEAKAPAAPSQPAATPGIDPGLAAVFDEFRTAVEDESDAVTDGDYETHYNLGLAYKEMDLVDEAVEEFQMAAGMVSPSDGTPRYLQCCNLLGHCFMQKGIPRLAAMWFKKGLDAPGHTEDEYQALRFELGTAYEQMGEIEKAIDVFTEVYGINISYRGVADKLRELQAQKTSQ